ncbi:hypothetical protein KNE206_58070 [Kitasatospora sp. NE20-6]|uniref:hypothetical protein n=1 Tax=Kitasatospora sp. NE20-6 TaxID=2859066 RepID=UPI0034DC3B3E
MRRRGFLLLGAAAAAPLAVGGVWLERESDRSVAAGAHKPPEVSTDLTWVGRDLVLLGPVVSAHWVQTSSAVPGDRLPIGPTDYYYDIVAHLAPGQVARLLGERPMTPEPSPPLQGAATGPWHAGWRVPAPLAPFMPPGASWVRDDELDASLVTADSAQLYFDRASDTVYVSAANLGGPDASATPVGPDGHTVTATPSQGHVLS